jgi:hypothetical protein
LRASELRALRKNSRDTAQKIHPRGITAEKMRRQRLYPCPRFFRDCDSPNSPFGH